MSSEILDIVSYALKMGVCTLLLCHKTHLNWQTCMSVNINVSTQKSVTDKKRTRLPMSKVL